MPASSAAEVCVWWEGGVGLAGVKESGGLLTWLSRSWALQRDGVGWVYGAHSTWEHSVIGSAGRGLIMCLIQSPDVATGGGTHLRSHVNLSLQTSLRKRQQQADIPELMVKTWTRRDMLADWWLCVFLSPLSVSLSVSLRALAHAKFTK